MKLALQVYVDADDALILWRADELDPKTRGFAVERELRSGGAGDAVRGWLDNLASPGTKPYQQGIHQPSNDWPSAPSPGQTTL